MASASSLVDDFNLGIGANWTTTGSGDASKVVAQYDSIYISHTAAAQYNLLESATTYDLTGSAFYVQIKDFGNQSIVSHDVELIVTLDASNSLLMGGSNNLLSCQKKVAGVQSGLFSTTLDRTAHQWFRIRESGGTVFWDTSPDGVTWTNRTSLANPFAMTALKVSIQCGCYAAETVGSYATFDNFNTLDPSPYSYVPTKIANRNVGPMALRQRFRKPLVRTTDDVVLDQAILPIGIDTGQAVGNPTVTQFVSPSGIGSAETLGAAAASSSLAPMGIGTGQAVGNPTVTEIVSPAGVDTGQAVGNPTVTQFVSPSGIGSAETLGAATSSPSVSPIGINTGQQVGNAAVVQSVSPSGVGSSEALGTATVSPILTPTGIGSAAALGAATLTQTVAPASIGSSEQSGTSTVTLFIAPAGIGTTQAAGSPTVGPSVSPTGIGPAEAVGSPSVTLALAPAGIESAQSVGNAVTAIAATQTVSPTGIGSTQALGAATVAQSISTTGIGSGQATGNPAIAQVVSPASIGASEALGSPTTSTANIIAPSGIGSNVLLGASAIGLGLNPLGIPSSETLGAPALTALSIIAPLGIGSGVGFGNPIIATTGAPQTVSPAGINSGSAFGVSAVGYSIAVMAINSRETFGVPTVLPGLVTVTPFGISSGSALGTANVGLVVSAFGVDSREVFGAITTSAIANILPMGIESITTVGVPSVLGTITLVMATIPPEHEFGIIAILLGDIPLASDRTFVVRRGSRILQEDGGRTKSVGSSGRLTQPDDSRTIIVPKRTE